MDPQHEFHSDAAKQPYQPNWKWSDMLNAFAYLRHKAGSLARAIDGVGAAGSGLIEKTGSEPSATVALVPVTTAAKSVLAAATVAELSAALAGTAETLSAAGAAGLTVRTTLLNGTNGSVQAVTLADGGAEQEKLFLLTGGTDDFTITPAHAWDFTGWKLTANARSLRLVYLGGKWLQTGGNAEVL